MPLEREGGTQLHTCAGPPCRAARVALHVSQQIPQNPGFFFQVQQQYRATPPLKGPVAPVALELLGVSHVKLPLKKCRATGGVAATLVGVALHCATKGWEHNDDSKITPPIHAPERRPYESEAKKDSCWRQ